MATIIKAKRETNIATLTLDDATGLVTGEHVHIYNINYQLDGDHILLSVDLATDTVTFADNGDDLAEVTVDGILVEEVTWIDADDVEEYLGYTPTALSDDEKFLENCVSAANAWAYRRRRSAGYKDNPTVAPGGAAKLGTILLAGAMFRQKGSVDGFQSYQDMTINAATGNYGEVMRLLGVNRAQVA
jgi:hypothetical protein